MFKEIHENWSILTPIAIMMLFTAVKRDRSIEEKFCNKLTPVRPSVRNRMEET